MLVFLELTYWVS